MAKLYFKYGAMGSSKSAQALITKFNYEEQGMTVWLIKPSADTRDGADIIKSRIGLAQHAEVILPSDSIIEKYHKHGKASVIISDECQFFTPSQIDELRLLVDDEDIPVLCFGLRTDFQTKFFPGSMRPIRSPKSRPSANAAPKRPSMPALMRAAGSSPRVNRFFSAEMTGTSRCATGAGENRSRHRKKRMRRGRKSEPLSRRRPEFIFSILKYQLIFRRQF